MYSFVDMTIIAVMCLVIGACVGVALTGVCAASGRSHEMDEWFLRELRYKEQIEQKDMEIREKSKFIARFRHKVTEIIQQYLQDDVASCTMIIASINAIKEGK